jgi:hypothetical protein
MPFAYDQSADKTAGELGWEALRFALHTAAAVAVLAALVFGFAMMHPDPDAMAPKVLCTVLTLLLSMLGGLAVAWWRRDPVAKHTWISGLLLFSVMCVWVLDLPTGHGLCENCQAFEKLYRTFFDISHGSGLMGGDGLLLGTWAPLAMIGYAIGARVGLSGKD